ncbi:hypothetical protein M1307_00435 [Patescibacteria group bacterium]|nr:hypothetical protein [Patescibacteria group bacterium]
MEYNKERKEEIENKILDILIEGLETGAFTTQQASEIANFVLVKIEVVNDQASLVNFLYDLSSKWSSFVNIYEIEDGKIERDLEQNAVKEALDLVKKGEIDQALNLAKSVDNTE